MCTVKNAQSINATGLERIPVALLKVQATDHTEISGIMSICVATEKYAAALIAQK
jgi:hypothetical protein